MLRKILPLHIGKRMGCGSVVSRLAFAPPEPTYSKDRVDIWLENSRGSRLPAFHLKHGAALTVLVSHMNGEDLGHVLDFWATHARDLGVNVFGYEYSGYGHATGTPSEANMHSDALAAIDWLTGEGGGQQMRVEIRRTHSPIDSLHTLPQKASRLSTSCSTARAWARRPLATLPAGGPSAG